MSFRYYPRYVFGNPQRRVFLPNFWMKLVPNEVEKPSNFVQFIVPLEMTERDIKNYLEKIYKIPVINVRTIPRDAKIKNGPDNKLTKEGEDYRSAYVQLPKGTNFEFPDLFPKQKLDEENENHSKTMQIQEKKKIENIRNASYRKDLPAWFT